MVVGFAFDLELDGPVSKKGRWKDECIGFTRKDLKDILQPHKVALVVMLWIGEFDVKRVMVDQGSGAEIMYPDLYEGLGLTLEDLTKYDSPLVAFNGTIIIPARQVTFPVEVEGRKDMVKFIVVCSYSPYIAILGHPWIHAMGTVPLSLDQKVKCPTEQGIAEVCGDQSVVWRCQVAAVGYRNEEKSNLAVPF